MVSNSQVLRRQHSCLSLPAHVTKGDISSPLSICLSCRWHTKQQLWLTHKWRVALLVASNSGRPSSWSFIKWSFLGTVKWNKNTREALAEILSEAAEPSDPCYSWQLLLQQIYTTLSSLKQAQLVPLSLFRYINKQQCQETTAVANVFMMRYAAPRAWKLQMHHARCETSN